MVSAPRSLLDEREVEGVGVVGNYHEAPARLQNASDIRKELIWARDVHERLQRVDQIVPVLGEVDFFEASQSNVQTRIDSEVYCPRVETDTFEAPTGFRTLSGALGGTRRRSRRRGRQVGFHGNSSTDVWLRAASECGRSIIWSRRIPMVVVVRVDPGELGNVGPRVQVQGPARTALVRRADLGTCLVFVVEAPADQIGVTGIADTTF